MHHFSYKRNELYCEDVAVGEIAARYGTPLYIYSKRTFLDHFLKIKRAFSKISPLICFSIKANSNLAILKLLAKQGAGMDVVSGGELYRALKIGVNPKKIVYAGVGKSEREIASAIRAGILFFNTESVPELALIDRVAKKLGKKANISLRVNPDVNPRTHKFITTGKKINKFGLDMFTVEELFLRSQIFSHLKLIGLHIHIGSQITQAEPFVKAIKKVLVLIARLKRKKIKLTYLNIGGGLGIVYKNEKPQTAQAFAKRVVPLLKKSGLKIILEPGRFIAGNSGILVTKVVYVKNTPQRNFAIVDAGMNDLSRPSLYSAYHEIVLVDITLSEKTIKSTYDIVGPICESGDFLAQERKLPLLNHGALLAVMSAGAYGFTMSSNYNSRPRVCEVLVSGKKHYLIRRRETYRDLTRHELLPGDLR